MGAVEQSIVHSLDGTQLPCITMRSSCRMYSLDLSKYAVYIWSHNCPIDNKDPEASDEKIYD